MCNSYKFASLIRHSQNVSPILPRSKFSESILLYISARLNQILCGLSSYQYIIIRAHRNVSRTLMSRIKRALHGGGIEGPLNEHLLCVGTPPYRLMQIHPVPVPMFLYFIFLYFFYFFSHLVLLFYIYCLQHFLFLN